MEKVVWLIGPVKNGLWSLMLEISRWMTLHGGRPGEVDSDQTEALIENDQHYTTWRTANLLKIPKPSTENY